MGLFNRNSYCTTGCKTTFAFHSITMIRLIVFICAVVASFQMNGQEEWDLKRCIEYAVANSIDVFQSDLSIKDAEVATKLSESQRYPNVNMSSNAFVNFGRSLDPTTDAFVTSTFFSNGYSVNTGVLLFDGGRIKNSIKQNQWLEKVSLADKDGMINLLTLDVVRAYFEILFAKDAHDNAAIQLKTITDQIDQMEKMVQAGSRARFEIYDLEAQQATIEQDLTLAQNRIDLGFLDLKGLLNLPSDFDMDIVKPPVDQDVFTNIDVITLDEAYQKALIFQPESRRLDYQIESAQLGVEVAKSAYYPSVSFGGSLSTNFSNQAKEVDGFSDIAFNTDVLINGTPSVITATQSIPMLVNTPYFRQLDNNFSYGFGVNISVPIYNNYTVQGSEERAMLSLQNFQAERDKNRIQLKNQMMQLLTDARAAKRSLEAADKTLRAREVAFENAEKRFNLGAINSYEYISIQDQLNTAQINQIIAKYDYMLKVKILDYYQGYSVDLN